MVYELQSSFGVLCFDGVVSGASRWFKMEIGEVLLMVIVAIWCALVLWWKFRSEMDICFHNGTACIIESWCEVHCIHCLHMYWMNMLMLVIENTCVVYPNELCWILVDVYLGYPSILLYHSIFWAYSRNFVVCVVLYSFLGYRRTGKWVVA